jgi:hypothetical protein
MLIDISGVNKGVPGENTWVSCPGREESPWPREKDRRKWNKESWSITSTLFA